MTAVDVLFLIQPQKLSYAFQTNGIHFKFITFVHVPRFLFSGAIRDDLEDIKSELGSVSKTLENLEMSSVENDGQSLNIYISL